MDIEIKEKESINGKKIIGTYVDSTIYDQLQKEADDNFMSMSSLVKKIIYYYLKDKQNNINNKNC